MGRGGLFIGILIESPVHAVLGGRVCVINQVITFKDIVNKRTRQATCLKDSFIYQEMFRS